MLGSIRSRSTPWKCPSRPIGSAFPQANASRLTLAATVTGTNLEKTVIPSTASTPFRPNGLLRIRRQTFALRRRMRLCRLRQRWSKVPLERRRSRSSALLERRGERPWQGEPPGYVFSGAIPDRRLAVRRARQGRQCLGVDVERLLSLREENMWGCSPRHPRWGGWNNLMPEYVRAQDRSKEATKARNDNIGLRCARTLAPGAR